MGSGDVEIVLIGDVLIAGFPLCGCLYCPCAHESLLSVDRFSEQLWAVLQQGGGTSSFTMTMDDEHMTIPLVKDGGLFYLQDPHSEETCCVPHCTALLDQVFPGSAPTCGLATCEQHGEYDRTHGVFECSYCRGSDTDRLEQCEWGLRW